MNKKKNFEESLARLDELVNALEKNEIPLDESIALFQEGLELVKECEGQLKNFEMKVEELTSEQSFTE